MGYGGRDGEWGWGIRGKKLGTFASLFLGKTNPTNVTGTNMTFRTSHADF